MARFFKVSSFHGKNNDAVTDLRTQNVVGIPYGWIPSCISAIAAHSLPSLFDEDFIVSTCPSTDFRLVIAAAHLSTQAWVKSKSFSTNLLSSDELEVIHMAMDLFAGWRCPQAVTMTKWKTLVSAIGMKLTPETRANLHTELLDEWKTIKGQAVGVDAGGGPDQYKVEIGLLGNIQDGGFTLVQWHADYERVLDALRDNTQHVVFPTDFTAETLYTQNVLWDDLNYKKGIIYLHRYAKKHWPELRRKFGKAALVFLASFMRTGDATDAWINRRAADLELALGLTAGEMDLPAKSISVFRGLTKISGLSKEQIHTGSSALARNSTKVGCPRIGWMVDQATYSGMTISGFLRLLAIYNNIPIGLVLGQMQDDLIQFLHAAMYRYLFPFSCLIGIKYPASKYPTLAAFTVRACKDPIGGSFHKYGGTFLGSHPDKVDAAHKVFNDLRTDSVSQDIVHNLLSDMMGSLQPTKFRLGSGHAVITTAPYAGERQERPEGMNVALYNISSIGPNYSDVSVPVTGLMKIAQEQEMSSVSTHQAIRILYKSINALKTAYDNSPCDAVYSINSFERPLPEEAHDLYEFALFVNASTMRCGED